MYITLYDSTYIYIIDLRSRAVRLHEVHSKAVARALRAYEEKVHVLLSKTWVRHITIVS